MEYHDLKKPSAAIAMDSQMRKTRWVVITGAPCSGKTSVVSSLELRGYRVVHEAARAYIGELLKSGKSLQEIKADELTFEKTILYRKLSIEANLPENKTVFLDRGIPDSIAYYLSAGLDPSEPLEKSRGVCYQKIFHFQRLRFQNDRVRAEDEQMAESLDQLLQQSYEMLGYPVVHVPVLTVEQRVAFILERLQ
jgi:predicted ATPase